MPAVTPALVEPLIRPDWEDRGALMGTLDTGETERVVAIAEYARLRDPAAAEVSFAVADDLQGRGIGMRLLEQLANIAPRYGIERFVARVLPENRPMLSVFMDAGFDVARRLDQGTVELEFPLAPTEAYHAHVDERDHAAVVASLRSFFEPESVAVLGASPRAGSIGGDLFRNIVAGGFRGRAYPVNREGTPVAGVEGYESIEQIPDPIDLAVVCLPGGLVLDGCEAALRHGTRALCVISAGFAEIGRRRSRAAGAAPGPGPRSRRPADRAELPRDRELDRFSQRHVRTARVPARVDRLLVAERRPRSRPARPGGGPGPRFLVLRLDREQGGRLVERPARVLGGRPGDRGRAALPRVVRESKALRTHRATGRAHQADPRDEEWRHRSAGSRAASSHTAALAGSETAVSALFRQAGVTRCDTLEELIDVAALLSTQPPLQGRRVAVLTNAGGLGILCADACDAAGLELPQLSEETTAALASVLPQEASIANPIDMLGSASSEQYELALPHLLEDPPSTRLIVIFVPAASVTVEDVGAAIERATSWPCQARPARAHGRRASGLVPLPRIGGHALLGVPPSAPIGSDVRSAPSSRSTGSIRTSLPRWSRPRSPRRTTSGCLPPTCAGSSTPTESPSFRSGSQPTPTRRWPSPRSWDSPWSSRPPSPAPTRPSKAAWRSTSRLPRTCGWPAERIGGPLVVQPMVEGGVELLAGLVQDPVFGPLVAFGPGGVLAELIGEARFRLAPIADEDARELVNGGKAGRLVAGFRGRPAADADALVDLVGRLARLGEDHPEVAELDLNPVWALATGYVVVDARVRVCRPTSPVTPKTW